jgi:hypothetical protein
LTLSFDAEMGTDLLKGHLQLPTRDEPLEDIDGDGVEIGAERPAAVIRRAYRAPAASEWAQGASRHGTKRR